MPELFSSYTESLVKRKQLLRSSELYDPCDAGQAGIVAWCWHGAGLKIDNPCFQSDFVLGLASSGRPSLRLLFILCLQWWVLTCVRRVAIRRYAMLLFPQIPPPIWMLDSKLDGFAVCLVV